MTRRFILIIALCIGFLFQVRSQNHFPYRKDSLWGFCDSNSQILIEPQYDYVTFFTKQGIATVVKNNKVQFIRKNGSPIDSVSYSKVSYFWNDKNYAWKDKKVGVIDTNGKVIIPFKYEDIRFSKNIIGLKKGDKWAFYSYKSGKRKSQFKFDDIYTKSSTLIPIKLNRKWGFANKKGRVKIKPDYNYVRGFGMFDLASVNKDRLWGFIDLKGEIIVEMIYSETRNFQTQGAWVKKGNSWGLIDSKGEVIIPFKFSRVSYFKEGLAYVKYEDKWGYIDSLGNTIIPFIYKNAFEFSEGLASVCIENDSCGYINKQGLIKIDFLYELNYGSEFQSGLAEVRKNKLYGFIDKNGNEIIPIKYKSTADYNLFGKDMGSLTDPKSGRLFYFNKKGVLFYQD